MGLPPATSFADVSSNPEVQTRLAVAYGHVNLIELWVGCLAEDPIPGSLVGELVRAVVREQFEKLRDGDRFWYTRHFRGAERRWLEETTLADVIRRNTTIGQELPNDVFRVPRSAR